MGEQVSGNPLYCEAAVNYERAGVGEGPGVVRLRQPWPDQQVRVGESGILVVDQRRGRARCRTSGRSGSSSAARSVPRVLHTPRYNGVGRRLTTTSGSPRTNAM